MPELLAACIRHHPPPRWSFACNTTLADDGAGSLDTSFYQQMVSLETLREDTTGHNDYSTKYHSDTNWVPLTREMEWNWLAGTHLPSLDSSEHMHTQKQNCSPSLPTLVLRDMLIFSWIVLFCMFGVSFLRYFISSRLLSNCPLPVH